MVSTGNEKTVLSVGLGTVAESLKHLPVHVANAATGKAALMHMRKGLLVDLLVSRWQLSDMKDGQLIGRFRKARPYVSTVAVTDKRDGAEESHARRLGVTAVVDSNQAGQALADIVEQALHLQTPVASAAGAGG